MNYAGILSPLGGWVKRIKALLNRPEFRTHLRALN